MSLGSGKQKALLRAGLRPTSRASKYPQKLAARYGAAALPGRAWGGGRHLAGPGMLPRSGAFPPTSPGVTLAGVHSPRAIARPP